MPHFEKMLYDNAQLIDLLTSSGRRRRARSTPRASPRPATGCCARWSPTSGGFAATYDADSEGDEGKFYVWDAAEIDAVLGRRRRLLQAGLRRHRRAATGSTTPSCIATARRRCWARPRSSGSRACARRLKAVRDQRVWPGWDDKVLADWNGLMIAALANAAAVFERDDWLARRGPRLALRHRRDARRERPAVPFAGASASGCIAARSTTTPTWPAPALALFEATGGIALSRRGARRWSPCSTAISPTRGRRLLLHRRRRRRPDRARQALPRQRLAGGQRHAGRRVRPAVGADGRSRLARQGPRQVAAFAGELESNFFPLMTPAERLRDRCRAPSSW